MKECALFLCKTVCEFWHFFPPTLRTWNHISDLNSEQSIIRRCIIQHHTVLVSHVFGFSFAIVNPHRAVHSQFL